MHVAAILALGAVGFAPAPAAPAAPASGTPGIVRAAAPTPCTPPWPPTFSDVGAAHASCTPIEWAADAGIATGYLDGTFRPAGRVTRGQAVAYLHRYTDPTFSPPGTPTFSDVPAAHPHFAAIEWAADVGIAAGYPDGTFRPASAVTRAQALAYLQRATDPTTPVPLTPTFSDVAATHPHVAAIEWAADSGIAAGYPDGTFRPGESVTRAHDATFLYRLSASSARASAGGLARISAGHDFSCAIPANAALHCWGWNDVTQLGDPTAGTIEGYGRISRVAVAATGAAPVIDVATGFRHACAVLEDTSVQCWGSANYGAVGIGSTEPTVPPTPVPGLMGAVRVGAGRWHSCALLDDGMVECWGANGAGELGDGTVVFRHSPAPVLGVSDAVDLAVGGIHTCALRRDGAVLCWGLDGSGQLGDTTIQSFSPLPVRVVSLDGVVDITAGRAHTCAALVDQTVRCWGDNSAGQLGDGTFVRRQTPVAVLGLADAHAPAAGGWRSCAVHADGSAACWGSNPSGALGDGTTEDRSLPVAVLGLAGISSLGVGDTHTCARVVDTTTWCWGSNWYGAVGDGTPDLARLSPVQVIGLP